MDGQFNNPVLERWAQGRLELTHGELYEQLATEPHDPQRSQYFTPLAIAQYFARWLPQFERAPDRARVRVLEPAVGQGQLLYGCPHWPQAEVTVYDLDARWLRLVNRLWPNVETRCRSPFEDWELLAGQFDAVLTNPPWHRGYEGMSAAMQILPAAWGLSWRREYCFAALAVHALRPGGWSLILHPKSFWPEMPQPFNAWLLKEVQCLPELFLPEELAWYRIEMSASVLMRR